MNTMRTGLLMAALMGLFLAVGYLLGREQGMLIAFVIAAGMNVFAYWNADKMVLRMHGARQVDRQTAPEFYGLVEDLARNAGQGLINRVSDVRLLQGDLAEAWGEGATEYATVAMKFSLIDTMIERMSGRVVSGGHPEEVTELWTFRRDGSGPWMLSAIQQTR